MLPNYGTNNGSLFSGAENCGEGHVEGEEEEEMQAVLEQELALCSVLKSVVCLWGLVPSGTPNPGSPL